MSEPTVTILVFDQGGDPTGSETRARETVYELPGDTPIRDVLRHVGRWHYGGASMVHIPFQRGCPGWDEYKGA